MQEITYGTSRRVTGTFPEVVERVKAAFKEQGFGVLCEIDVQATLREKIGAEIEPYLILGMCNPNLASKAIAAEHQIGLLLPCNVLVHECEGAVHVGAQNPHVMLSVAQNEQLGGVADEAKMRMDTALSQL